jgi:hypothetical protein
MKSSPDAPPAPDPQASASAQTGSNIATAIANARLNRVDQTTPWGSISYQQGPVDANGVPTYSSSIKLDPQQQALLDAQRGQQLQRNQTAGKFLDQVSTKPLDLSHLNNLYDRYGDMNQAPPQPQQSQQPQQQMSRDDMMAMLQQYMQSQGQQSAGANPLARGSGPGMGVAAALRNAPAATTAPTAGTTPATVANPNAKDIDPDTGLPGWLQLMPQGADAFGSMGKDPIYNTSIEYNGPAEGRPIEGYNMGGPVTVNGQQSYRVANLPRTKDYFKNTDPSQFHYDPKYGMVTSADNVTGGVPESFYDKYAPWLMLAGAGAGAAGAFGAGAGATEGSALGTGAFDVGGSTGFGGTVPLEAGGASAGAGTGAGISASGAPVTDLSVAAPQQNMFSQAYENWANGRGVLGNRVGSRIAGAAAGPLLARIIRGAGGGK